MRPMPFGGCLLMIVAIAPIGGLIVIPIYLLQHYLGWIITALIVIPIAVSLIRYEWKAHSPDLPFKSYAGHRLCDFLEFISKPF